MCASGSSSMVVALTLATGEGATSSLPVEPDMSEWWIVNIELLVGLFPKLYRCEGTPNEVSSRFPLSYPAASWHGTESEQFNLQLTR